MKKMIYMSSGSSTSCWKPWRWVRLDLLLMMIDISVCTFDGYIYIYIYIYILMIDISNNSNLNPPTKFTSSSRSNGFKDILLWNISQMITKIIPISTRIVIKYVMKQSILFWVYREVNGNWENNMIKISQWR